MRMSSRMFDRLYFFLVGMGLGVVGTTVIISLTH